jgi:hypothetical protein
MWTRIGRAAVLLAGAAVCAGTAAGQPLRIVDVAMQRSAATAESLVPAGWTIEQRYHADFNRDGRADVLLLLRQSASEGTIPPRMILVALARKKPPGYAPAETNERLVPRDPSGALEDPMADGEIKVRPGGFELKLGMMSGVGSYLAATMRYRFRHEGGCFRLIGYERAETHRATLDTRDMSVNFLTGVVVRTTGNAQSNAKQIERRRLPANPRRCLGELDSAWTFDPLR